MLSLCQQDTFTFAELWLFLDAVQANVLHTFKARMAEELTVNEGEVVTVTEAEDADWWKVTALQRIVLLQDDARV